MTGPHDPRDGDGEGEGEGEGDAHVDPMSVIEAEADADAPDLEHGLIHLVHPAERSTDGPRVAPDTIGTEPAPNLRADRQRFLVAYLRIALVLAFAIGVLELVLPEDLRDEAAVVMVAVFVAAPIGRIVWLIVRWLRLGDRRFAIVGAVLLAVVATGFLAR
jgi:hypothetical protein